MKKRREAENDERPPEKTVKKQIVAGKDEAKN